MTDRLLLIGVVGLASGILCRSLFGISWQVVVLTGIVALALFIIGRIRTAHLYTGMAVFLMCVSLGAGRTVFVPVIPPASFQILFDSKVALTGSIVRDPDLRETTQRITVEVVEEGARMRVLVVSPLYPEYRYGERVRIEGTLKKPEPFDTNGGREFRYDQFLAKDGIFGIVNYGRVEKLEEAMGLMRIRGTLFDAKRAFVEGLGRALTEPYSALAAGIITGGKQGLGKELLLAFTIAGLLPVVVLSGYNVMIVSEAVLRASRFLPRFLSASIAGLVILLFVLAAGSGASAFRAGLMAGIGLFARATGRTYDALRALLAVFVLMLLENPLLLVHDPGFQFSFVATLGLIIGAPVIEPYLTSIKNAFMRDILATTLAAQVFVLPLLLYQTGNLSLVALLANVLVLPVVPFAMLFSALAGGAGLIAPALAPLLGAPAFVLLWFIVAVAETLAGLPLAQVIIPAFPFWIVVLLYGLIAVALKKLKHSAQTERRSMRRFKGAR